MRLFCWNVNSLVPTVRNVNLKYGSLAAWFAQLDADIICMQEVKLPDSKLTKDLVIIEGYQSYWACSQSKTGYSGVTTWVRHSFAASSAAADPFSCEGCDKEGRALVTDHGAFVLFNVYVPNAGDRPERARLAAKLSFLTALRERVEDLLGAGRQVILVGDFNIAAAKRDVHDAISWDNLYHQSELKALHDITGPEGCNCTDTWRHLHPNTEGVYTVWEERTSARAFNVGVRIDYALVSSGLLDKVQSSEVLLDLPPKWSDHAPLMLELEVPAQYAAAAAAATTVAAAAAAQATQQAEPQQQQQQLPPAPACAMWQQLLRRFQDPSQRSIATMFKAAGGKVKPAAQQQPVAKQKHPVAIQPPGSGGGGGAAAAPAAGKAAGSSSGASVAAMAAVNGKQHGSARDINQRSNVTDAAASHMASAETRGTEQDCGAEQWPAAADAADGAESGQTAGGSHAVPSRDPQQQQHALQGHGRRQGLAEQSMLVQQQKQQQEGGGMQQEPQQPMPQPVVQQSSAQRGKTSSRQPASSKREAADKPDAAAAKAPKQAKLHSFFSRPPPGQQ